MCGFTIILASNVYGFGAWAIDSAEKGDILEVGRYTKSRAMAKFIRFKVSRGLEIRVIIS